MIDETHERVPFPTEDNEGMTLSASLERTEPIYPADKPKRKSPERYGPVQAVDLERLRGMDEPEQFAELERLILRAKIAEANTAKAARLAAKAKK